MQSQLLRRSTYLFRRRFAVKAIGNDSELAGFMESKELSVIDFGAGWCGPCRALKPVLEDLSEKHTSTKFVYVDIDEFQDLAADHEIQGVPTVLFYKDGKQIDKIVGFDPNKLTALIEKHEN